MGVKLFKSKNFEYLEKNNCSEGFYLKVIVKREGERNSIICQAHLTLTKEIYRTCKSCILSLVESINKSISKEA
ncbi:hypothetical protein RCL_jg27710.t1 [Rhizophagus clarus]|uniref:Uncharacterized protein n=1 Tax=Rhizophagus clarus TaxID=94130 RepID=A0A8H3MCZ4_9GLOM|nr:hypothetical protein RCL_jg27710.t1 [Rhizophagus clarus]